MNDNSKIIFVLLTGLAAGAAFGLLFAPEVGSVTRDKIAESLSSAGNSIKDLAMEQADKLSDLVEDFKIGGNDTLQDDLEHA